MFMHSLTKLVLLMLFIHLVELLETMHILLHVQPHTLKFAATQTPSVMYIGTQNNALLYYYNPIIETHSTKEEYYLLGITGIS